MALKGMIPDWLRREFELKNLYFEHPNEKILYRCQWKWPPSLYIMVRTLLSGYSIYAIIHHSLDSGHSSKSSVVYFSFWSYLLLVLHLVTSTPISFYFYRQEVADDVHVELPAALKIPAADNAEQHKPAVENYNNQPQTGLNDNIDAGSEVKIKVDYKSDTTLPDRLEHANGSSDEFVHDARSMDSVEKQEIEARQKELQDLHSTYESFSHFHSINIETTTTKWYLQASWCLSNVASASAPVATALFFSEVYHHSTNGLDIANINVQILNIIFVIIDHIISARPIRLLHVVAPIVFGLIYIIFTLIYWSTVKSNPVIYDVILDWTYPGATIGFIIALSCVVFPVIQFIFIGIYHMKELIHKKLYGVHFDENTH